MIQHVVMWKFADFAEGKSKEENMEWVREHLLALVPIIPQIKRLDIGRDIGGTEMSYDMVLIMEFDSMDDLQTYKVHPDHKAVSAYVKKVRVGRVTVDRAL